MTRIEPEFLTLAELVAIHRNQMELYGGEPGIRDIHLLSSALAMPLSSFGGTYLHPDIFDMASAYAYHLCQNHPFIDGNKRAALVAALVFLDINGIEVEDAEGRLYNLMMRVAKGTADKKTIALVLRHCAGRGE